MIKPRHYPALYNVHGYPGAHYLRELREIANGEIIADVQLIGADLPYSVPATHITPYDRTQPIPHGSTITDLAQEAAIVYDLDPARICRAANIARQKLIRPARFNGMGDPITPSLDVLAVRGSRGWYTVYRGSCTCPDHHAGHICKHRIAAWMYRESIIRSLATARQVDRSVIIANDRATVTTTQDW